MVDEQIQSKSEKKKEDWMNAKWRPMMGWMYMAVCTMDFVVFPILWSLLQSISHGAVNVQWQPLTLQGAGLFHIAMGAVIGISAYGRTQEKLNGVNNGGLALPTGIGTTYTPPAPIAGTGFSSITTPPASGVSGSSIGSPSTAPTGFGSGTGFGTGTTTAQTVVTGFGGKPAPIQPDHPAI
jgi:hypothetical protein